MSGGPRFADDVSGLPTHAFGPRSLTWWGVIGFMTIEGTAFAMAFAAYFFLMSHEQGWPPEARQAPNLIAGTLFTLVILASEIPNTLIKRAANAHDLPTIRKWLPVIVAIGAVLIVIRAFEFPSLNVRWSDNAYGSIMWALLLLHSSHILTDWVDTVVLWALMRTSAGEEGRRMVDTDENALYWRFVWLTWLPIYLMLYWVPRWA
jgi:heme/copper-type cytochrome/quinol oxidase subunit 3